VAMSRPKTTASFVKKGAVLSSMFYFFLITTIPTIVKTNNSYPPFCFNT
jgi:hypothetical protein